ncbi:MAG: DEAD/DEAH box helicase [Actinomycetota bacterium]
MIRSFADAGISADVVTTLARRGIDTPFAIQTMVLPDALAGRDVLAKSATGSGKTLAFALPIVETLDPAEARPSALVLVPTRELASQVAGEFEDIVKVKGLRVAVAYGGTSVREQARHAAKAHVLVATPGRLEDLASRNLVSLDRVRILILDEADRMLDMGFQPQVDRLVDRLPSKRQTMFFSATLDGEIGRLARAYTHDAVLHELETERPAVEEVDHKFIPVSSADKTDALAALLSSSQGSALVFVRTKRGVDRLVHKLRTRNIRAGAMHGDMSQAARERALADFAAGRVSTLIATDVAARGLDLEAISHVINFDPPSDDKAFVHRVGRTGRAGRAGISVTFVAPEHRMDLGRMASRLKLTEEFELEGMKVAPPQVVYSASRRGRSPFAPPRRRGRR